MSSFSLAIKRSCDQVCHSQAKKAQPSRVVPASVRLLGYAFNLISLINIDWASSRLSNFWFTVFKPKPRDWVYSFWNEAERSVEVHLSDKTIPVYLWGRGPLIVCMHGWAGSGTQFRYLIPSLVKAGYRVAVFDAPAHGFNPERTTHVLEFAQSLLAIEQQIAPIHTVVAHSFGAMATLTASYHGLTVENMVFIAPGLDVEEIFQSYSQSMNLNQTLSDQFHYKVGQKMADIANIDQPWTFFQPENLMKHSSESGLLIFDHDDEEISLDQFRKIASKWQCCDTHETQGLGHFRLLKDDKVISKISEHVAGLKR